MTDSSLRGTRAMNVTAPKFQPQMRVIVISPAKDEARYIERTIVSVTRQTVRPARWIIVDDGSIDETPEIIRRYAQSHDWIVPVTIHRDSVRRTGSAEILAFYMGFELILDQPWDFVMKLDTDLELPPDYIERLLEKFQQDMRLGIASGIYLEPMRGEWRPVKMPDYHAAGASKMVRRQCFLDIGGFPRLPGWDTADEIKAQTRGWLTCHFPEVKFYHFRPEGRGLGLLRTSKMHGKMYYACGGGGLFFFLKAVNRMVTGRPFVISAIALIAGYVSAVLKCEPRLVTTAEIRFYRKLLIARLARQLRRLLLAPFTKQVLSETHSR